MFYYYDPTYVLILIGAIVALYAQIKVPRPTPSGRRFLPPRG